jgi:hypothetical protein
MELAVWVHFPGPELSLPLTYLSLKLESRWLFNRMAEEIYKIDKMEMDKVGKERKRRFGIYIFMSLKFQNKDM